MRSNDKHRAENDPDQPEQSQKPGEMKQPEEVGRPSTKPVEDRPNKPKPEGK